MLLLERERQMINTRTVPKEDLVLVLGGVWLFQHYKEIVLLKTSL